MQGALHTFVTLSAYLDAGNTSELVELPPISIFSAPSEINLKKFAPAEMTKPVDQAAVNEKIAIYCPQGSGTLRQQLLMMH